MGYFTGDLMGHFTGVLMGHFTWICYNISLGESTFFNIAI